MSQSYKIVNYGKKSVRRNYSKIRSDIDMPDLVEIQTGSFDYFVSEGLKEVLRDNSPIVSLNGNLEIYFGGENHDQYHFDDPKYSVVEARLRRTNFARPLKATVELRNTVTGEVTDDELFLGDVPYMTPVGTFIINGAERVVISQIVRSAGVYYSKEINKKSGDINFSSQIIPTRGAWLEYETGSKKIWYGKLDRSRKMPLTRILRALGLAHDEEILDLFIGDTENSELKAFFDATFEHEGKVDPKIDAKVISDEAVSEIFKILRPGDPLTIEGARETFRGKLFEADKYDLQEVGRSQYNFKLDVLERAKGKPLSRDVVYEQDYADPETGEIHEKGEVVAKAGEVVLGEVYNRLKDNRAAFRKEIDCHTYIEEENPFNEILYVLIEHGSEKKEVKIIGNDQRQVVTEDLETRKKYLHITISDILATFSYYFNLHQEVGSVDDIDELSNRRLRLIGELLQNQFRIAFGKLKKNILDRMSTVEEDKATPKSLVTVKPIQTTLREFFGSSQLSQFMDQINPLAEITQKRRISALGSGGIQRDRAGVEVRDVHNSHYGRMCPIETPEGPSIGLITSLATYAKINKFGFIETPYFVVKKDEQGKSVVTEELVYLSAREEKEKVIAAATPNVDKDGHFIGEQNEPILIGRRGGETEMVAPNDVQYMDVSPKQIVSVAAACVPFLEHDDATRALMGANMQRQAVPIIAPESPIVGTGMEYRAAKDSGSACVASMGGVVEYADSKKIIIREDNGDLHKYDLYQFLRSNSSTAIMQRPIVKAGERVERGDIIADGQSMRNGELALGRNVRIAFMTWDGYNFEDAVIMSERMVYDDVYTTLNIQDYDVDARDTKMGAEEFTREVPNVGQDDLKYLDENGIVIPGTEVREGDILVGKTTPKGQTDPTAEEKLMNEIFGDKARDRKDTSLRVPHGGGGIVQSIQHFKKSNGDELQPGVNEVVRVFIIQKRKIQVGDKMAGRHGNKGVISNILPLEDMPFSADGQPIDIMLNPQGVPSRMNIGQVLELHLGLAARKITERDRKAYVDEVIAKTGKKPTQAEIEAAVPELKVATPVFDGATIEDIEDIMKEAGVEDKITLYDGRTGEPFENKISVGIMYFIRLVHMVDDKIHARNVGKYTLVTQQPMGGKAQNGGQRFGEMEVWALQAYGAANVLREMITIKSDDLVARDGTFNAIVDGKPLPDTSIPESFRVLTRELHALGLHVELINNKGENEANRSIVDSEIKRIDGPRASHSKTVMPEDAIKAGNENN